MRSHRAKIASARFANISAAARRRWRLQRQSHSRDDVRDLVLLLALHAIPTIRGGTLGVCMLLRSIVSRDVLCRLFFATRSLKSSSCWHSLHVTARALIYEYSCVRVVYSVKICFVLTDSSVLSYDTQSFRGVLKALCGSTEPLRVIGNLRGVEITTSGPRNGDPP